MATERDVHGLEDNSYRLACNSIPEIRKNHRRIKDNRTQTTNYIHIPLGSSAITKHSLYHHEPNYISHPQRCHFGIPFPMTSVESRNSQTPPVNHSYDVETVIGSANDNPNVRFSDLNTPPTLVNGLLISRFSGKPLGYGSAMVTKGGEILSPNEPYSIPGIFPELLPIELQKSVNSYHRRVTAKQILEAGQLEWKTSRTYQEIMQKLTEYHFPLDS